MAGYRETYNQYKKRIEAERRQAYFDRSAARTNRKERELPETEQRLKWLRAQVLIDEREQVEDDKAEEERLKQKEQATSHVTKQQPISRQTIQEEEDVERQLQEYVKAREQ
jgi:hypothetical protein